MSHTSVRWRCSLSPSDAEPKQAFRSLSNLKDPRSLKISADPKSEKTTTGLVWRMMYAAKGLMMLPWTFCTWAAQKKSMPKVHPWKQQHDLVFEFNQQPEKINFRANSLFPRTWKLGMISQQRLCANMVEGAAHLTFSCISLSLLITAPLSIRGDCLGALYSRPLRATAEFKSYVLRRSATCKLIEI